MKLRKSLLILIIGFFQLPLVNAQITGLCPNVAPYTVAPANCIWLSNQTADQIKSFYLGREGYKPEKIISLSENNSKGFRLYYRHEGSLGWQKYWIKIMTVDLDGCVAYYKDNQPDLLMVPFAGLKSQVGQFDHTPADFKKVYRQYQYLACKLYRQLKDSKGTPTSEMSLLLQRYMANLPATDDHLMASSASAVATTVNDSRATTDNWNYWLQFFQELDSIGYITLIEYSTSPE